LETRETRILDDLGVAYTLREHEVDPSNAELDGKALARRTGDRPLDLVSLREEQRAGYVRGGVTALGGVRGTQILIAPADYLRVTHAVVMAIARGKRTSSKTAESSAKGP
jgi:prolyl-tRNA editing enzyme YbaK/EbsC (Cys-tRNA(Pro) deacylase)